MPELDEVLIDYLKAQVPLTALVGQNIKWDKREQGLSPPDVILYKISDGARDYNMEGPSGLVRQRIQAEAWGKTKAEALLVARALRTALSGLTYNQSGVQIQGIFLDGEGGNFDADTNEAEIYSRVRYDFIVWHSE